MRLRDLGRNAAYRSLHVLARGRPHLILLYHSIGGDAEFSVPANMFDRQMELVAQHFTVVTLTELYRTLAAGGPPVPLACVTVDDGYRDNYEHALPILTDHGLRGTFYVATGFLGGAFRTWAGEHPMMTREQVRGLAALGHEVGAHTVTHPKLTELPAHEVSAEATTSKHVIEDITGHAVRSFAYPKGAYNEAVKRLVGEAGYETAVTIREGVLAGALDWLALPRLAVNTGLSLAAFEAKLSYAAHWYHRLRRRA